jgi:hypothetical protein
MWRAAQPLNDPDGAIAKRIPNPLGLEAVSTKIQIRRSRPIMPRGWTPITKLRMLYPKVGTFISQLHFARVSHAT